MLHVKNIEFDYADHTVLSGICFELGAGSLLHLRGANGSGKTTLLRLIAGLIQPVQGEIILQTEGRDNLSGHFNPFCFIGHKPGINLNLTVAENCFFDLHHDGVLSLYELASVFRMEQHLDTRCYHLSEGQKKKVSLLRLWMSRSLVWLLDEPLVALDESSVHILMKKINAHRLSGGCVIISSHQTLPAQDYEEYLL